MKDKYYYLILSIIGAVLVGVVFALNYSGNTRDEGDFLELKSIIEPTIIWESSLNDAQLDMTLDDGKLYVVTEENFLHVVDAIKGEMLKTFNLNDFADFGAGQSGMDVHDGVVAINFSNRLLVFDTNRGVTLMYHVISDSIASKIGGKIFIDDKHLLFRDISIDYLYSFNYRTNEMLWSKYKEAEVRKCNYKIYHFDDRYFYKLGLEDVYYEITLKDGNVINTYSKTELDTISNSKQSGTFTFYKNADTDLNEWLSNKDLGRFIRTGDGLIYSYYDNILFLHDEDKNLLWNAKFDKEIYMSNKFGNFVILDFDEQVAMLDLISKEVVWYEDIKIGKRHGIIINDSIAYMPTDDGEIIAYDFNEVLR